MMTDPGLFKQYDIRGKYGDTLTDDAAWRIGKAFGTYLQRRGVRDVVVGRDNRTSSPALAEAAIKGLVETGCNVTDIGMAATPVVYWCAVEAGDAGGMMITGSHLKPAMNGFKLSIGKDNLYGDQIQVLREMIDASDFVEGEGQSSVDETANERYLAMAEGRLHHARPLKIVVDAGNGIGGIYGPALLEALGHTVICLYCKPDGTYPHHQPDPQNADNLRDLVRIVQEQGADLGLAYDGDADRVGVVDERGNVVGADRILVLLARDILKRNPGAMVVGDVLSTQVLFDEIAKAGGSPLIWKSGHSMIKAKMAEEGALLGGEMSGHIFLGDGYYGFDDGIFVGARIVQLVTEQDQPLSALMATVPTLYATPEYRPHCPDDQKARVIGAVQQALDGQYAMNDVDGIRITFERGWGLLRASNTEPVLSLRFEGETLGDALSYKDIVREALVQAYPEVEPF
ncbi:phosphomannomutase/phosphoglucomutase [Aggregatilinea lenta]|uniref:phosphomannomutase/phosphoglucomutase n=1 Tax=Aggregatilinea lenta TaxID=913108 RepID=UPI0013C34F42|nr:phosphomannomutase/phosphoglucomutase [Aggregatilinea lenta]